MNNRSVTLRKPLALFGVGLSLIAAPAAFAQTSPVPSEEKKEETLALDRFVVTGSYLPLSGSVTASPVVTIQKDAIGMSGATNALAVLKQLTPYFSGNNSVGTELNNGGRGESNVQLRNLNTLVLLNGMRMTSSPISASTSSTTIPQVDLNTIPTAMIERIEILKDGASTIYGSDAISGVVNIILKKNYNGFEVGARNGRTGNGDYQTREFYVVGGFATDTGSLTVSAQHFENTTLRTTDRPLTTMTPAQFTALGTASGGIPASMSGSFPGRVDSSIFIGSPLAAGAPGYDPTKLSPGIKSSPSVAGRTLVELTAAGIYVPISATDLGKAVGSATILNTTLFGNPLIVPTKRNQFIANGHKHIFGKSLEVFNDFLFAQTINGGSGLAPTPISGVGASGANALFIPANNPYNLFGVDFGVGAAPGAPSARTRTEELGNRSSLNETNTWRAILGFRGEINDRYSWEVSYNYNRASALQQILGGANGANMNQLMIPKLTAAGGYTYDAQGRPLSILADGAGNLLPVYNYFAVPGFNAESTLNAIRTTLFQSSNITLRSVQGLFRGKPFELPAGDFSFALGGESRKETVSGSVDGLFANGLALGYTPANIFTGGARRFKSVFLETNTPLASKKMDIPGVYAADLTVAMRYEKVLPGGNATTPKLGLRYLPFDDSLALRATWAKGFIAPSIYALFGPSKGNAPSYTILEGNGQSFSGGSTGKFVTGQFGSASELSNTQAESSKSKSYTFGVVYSPKRVKGLSVSLDYYHIAQDKTGDIDYSSVYADLNAKGSASVFASGFVFADNSRLTTTAANQVTSTNVGNLAIKYDPAGDRWVDGLDIGVDYTFSTDTLGKFNVGANANVLFNNKFQPVPGAGYFQYARNFTDTTNGKGGASGLQPSYLIKPYVNHTYRSLTTSLSFTYLPSVVNQGMLFAKQSATNTQRLDGKAQIIPSYFSADLSVSYIMPHFGKDWARNVTVTLGANNLFNKDAPYVTGGGNNASEANTAKSAYDIVGCFMFLELKKAF